MQFHIHRLESRIQLGTHMENILAWTLLTHIRVLPLFSLHLSHIGLGSGSGIPGLRRSDGLGAGGRSYT